MDSNEPVIESMKRTARAALENAYCPYSGFQVGAAVLTKSGEILVGVNVENASFGLTICAERSAVFQAVARGLRELLAVVIVTSGDSPAPPCGACLQVLNEFGRTIKIFSFDARDRVLKSTLAELLPHSFGPRSFG